MIKTKQGRPTEKQPATGLLKKYQSMRDFSKTAEPSGTERAPKLRSNQRPAKSDGNILARVKKYRFVVQKHAASHLHYDFRLEWQGVLKSWAIPKGPSTDPAIKRLAMMTEDHPMAYAGFEGTIPAGEYGGGSVMVWDKGSYINLTQHNGQLISFSAGLARGHVDFWLAGKKLKGGWSLFKIGDSSKEWLLKKMQDDAATEGEIVDAQPLSVLTRRTIDQIGADKKSKTWHSNR